MSQAEERTVVCFDLGGVLVRICRTWAEACEVAELPLRELHSEAQEGLRAHRQSVVDGYQRGTLSCGDYYEALSAALDGAYSVAEVELIHHVWTREQYPGIDDLIAALNALPGFTTACLSNTNHAHWQRLAGGDGRSEYPAVEALERRLASHEMGCLKPEPEIYAQAHEVLTGGVAGGRIIFFDDLPENVEAARRHGWSAYHVDPGGDPATQMRAILNPSLGGTLTV